MGKPSTDELRKQLKKKKETSDLFGKEKDQGFRSSLLSTEPALGG
jgi:hypothetical protein